MNSEKGRDFLELRGRSFRIDYEQSSEMHRKAVEDVDESVP